MYRRAVFLLPRAKDIIIGGDGIPLMNLCPYTTTTNTTTNFPPPSLPLANYPPPTTVYNDRRKRISNNNNIVDIEVVFFSSVAQNKLKPPSVS
jgi:hypothetical protein